MKTIESYDDIKAIQDAKFSLVVAKTHTCGTCKSINEHLASTIDNFSDLNTYQIFVDDIDQFRGEAVIFSVPTVLIYADGKELLRESRFINTQKINRLIQAYLD